MKKWDKFFFEPKPVESIALFRIVWALILLCYFFLELGNINDFYGTNALISLKTAESGLKFLHVGLFQFLPTTSSALYTILVLYFLALMGTLFGFFTRSSLIVLLICMTSFHQRNVWILNSSEVLMRSVTLLLIFSPCGNAFSIDDRRNQKPKEWSPWVLRLLQLQLSVVYLWTVWHKAGGADWLNGTAVYYATRLTDIRRFPVPFLLDSILMIRIFTWGTLALEFSLGAFLWVKEMRVKLIIMGILFHLSLEYAMLIPFFQVIMIALLLLFITPEEVRDLYQRINKSKVHKRRNAHQ